MIDGNYGTRILRSDVQELDIIDNLNMVSVDNVVGWLEHEALHPSTIDGDGRLLDQTDCFPVIVTVGGGAFHLHHGAGYPLPNVELILV